MVEDARWKNEQWAGIGKRWCNERWGRKREMEVWSWAAEMEVLRNAAHGTSL
jgi:hypothetical protein